MLYKDGDVLWHMPIRYWETQEPTKCIVTNDQNMTVHSADEFNTHGLYVYSYEYGHCVYVSPAECWYDKDNAIRAALLRKWLLDMRKQEETRIVVDRMFAEKNDGDKEIE